MLPGFDTLTPLLVWCRTLRHGLDVGLDPVRVFRQQAKSGPGSLRPVADRIADRLATGDSLEDALKPEAGRFPPLFVQLVAVGEQTGRLPDVFRELEDHFTAVKEARKALLTALIWPCIMYVGAILIIAFMLLVLGMLGSNVDPLGFGLVGTKGAVVWLVIAGSFTATVLGTLAMVGGSQRARSKAEAALLNAPVLGDCFRAFALSRFCSSFHMTAEAGLRADRCLRFSLNATANEAYQKQADYAAKAARKGEDVPGVLAACGPRLFPEAFVSEVQVGEDSGRLAEVLKKQAEFFREEARRKLKVLAQVIGGGVYAMVAIMVIVLIFKLAFFYLGMIDQFTNI